MALLINFAILVGLVGPICTYHLYFRDYEGSRFSRKFIRKFTWGLRYLILPAISLKILLATDLRGYCIALFCIGVFGIATKLILGTDRARRKTDFLYYFFYAFLYLTWAQNNPYWIQIWPTIVASFGLVFVTVVVMRDKHQLIIPSWPDVLPRSQKLMFRILGPSMFLFFLVGNECFRRFASFEVWATYSAFNVPLMVFLVGLCTVIIVPLIGEERLEAFDKEPSSPPHS